MKTAIICAVLLALGAVYLYSNSDFNDSSAEALYHNFLAEYNKNIPNGDEYQMRLKIFKDNLKMIEKHNAQENSYTMGLNQFSDMTMEEYKKYLGYNPVSNRLQADQPKGVFASTVDWRTKGAVNPVVNQGSCISCWAFSAAATVEGRYAIAHGKLYKFSEQQLVDCSKNDDNDGCNGGFMDFAFIYLFNHYFCLSSDYPYKGVDGICKYDDCKRKGIHAVTGHKAVTPNQTKALKEALNSGPVSVAVEANNSAFKNYKGGIINSDCGENLDHGVTAVGYGVDEKQGEYFIVRNSWGTTWGESGYFKIGTGNEGKGGVCGILTDPSYVVS